MIERYKMAKPMTYDELQSIIPRYGLIPIYWDSECYLYIFNRAKR